MVDYWFYAKITAAAGTEPAIFWRFHSDGSQGGNFSPAGSLPKRMQESGRRHVIYWWFNQGGAVVQRDVRTIIKAFDITKTQKQRSTPETSIISKSKIRQSFISCT